MRAKHQYVRQHHLGGVMFWEMGQDTMDAELLNSLVGNGPASGHRHPDVQ
jgi:GH18 family chitinase